MYFYSYIENCMIKIISISQTLKFLKISFITASKEQSTEEYNLTQEVKDLYTENYKILMKEIKEDANKRLSPI